MLGSFQQEILEGLRCGKVLSKEHNWTGRPWRKVVRAIEPLIRQGKIEASNPIFGDSCLEYNLAGYIFPDHLSGGGEEDSQPLAADQERVSLEQGVVYRVWHVTNTAGIFELEVVRTDKGYLSREMGESAWEDEYLFKLGGLSPSYFLTYQDALVRRDSLLSRDERADKILFLKNKVKKLTDKITKVNQRIERLERENG